MSDLNVPYLYVLMQITPKRVPIAVGDSEQKMIDFMCDWAEENNEAVESKDDQDYTASVFKIPYIREYNV